MSDCKQFRTWQSLEDDLLFCSAGWSLTRRLDLPVDLLDPIVRLESLDPETRRFIWFEIDENSDAQSVISVKHDECSSMLGVADVLPPMVVAFDDVDVTNVAFDDVEVAFPWTTSLRGLGEFELDGCFVCCCCFSNRFFDWRGLRPDAFLEPRWLGGREPVCWGHWSHSHDEPDNSWK